MSKNICTYCGGKDVEDGRDWDVHDFMFQLKDEENGIDEQRSLCKDCFAKALAKDGVLPVLVGLFDLALGYKEDLDAPTKG